MKIRKTFKWEGAHIVRDCTSRRCSKSIHGHSYECELIFTGGLDNGGMVYDFGLLKGVVADFIDAFDHAITLWSGDQTVYLLDMKVHSERWVELPVNPTAENYAAIIGAAVSTIMTNTIFRNNALPTLTAVKVHETRTGCAHAVQGDWMNNPLTYNPSLIVFSDRVLEEMKTDYMEEYLRGEMSLEDPVEV